MKSILMSIKPKYVAKILNKEKTIEVRKRFSQEYRGWVYIYCTKDKMNKLCYVNYEPYGNKGYLTTKLDCENEEINGKVVARFYCDNVEEISYNYRSDFTSVYTDTLDTEDLEKQAFLTRFEFAEYLQGNYGYAIHISQLEIFDKPKELSDFFKLGVDKWYHEHAGTDMPYLEFWNTFDDFRITKAPQSWQFIEVVE